MNTSRPEDVFQDIGNHIAVAIGMTSCATIRDSAVLDDRRLQELKRHLERAGALATHLCDQPSGDPISACTCPPEAGVHDSFCPQYVAALARLRAYQPPEYLTGTEKG